MFRFLILCTVFFLLYLGFNTIGEFDSSVNFSVFRYKVETTLFTFLFIFLIIQIILMIILKTIFLVFDIPLIIRKNLYKKKLKKINERLLQVVTELLMGNKQKSLELSNKLLPDLDENNNEVAHLVLAESESSFDLKIQHLRSLLDKKNYSLYAAKKLAEIFFEAGHYREAEEYALKAFNENDTDSALMIMLIRIYAKLGSWPRMVFIVSKLQRADIKLFESFGSELAEYYYLAAKSTLAAGNDPEAANFLESSLELKPDFLEALNLFIELNVNLNNSASMIKILKAAFVARPCFEIAEMYAKCSRSSANVVYGTLAGLVKPSENNALFLAIAAYLGLHDKISVRKDGKA
jgi:tetratricopeptide (TPR) repeat protein